MERLLHSGAGSPSNHSSEVIDFPIDVMIENYGGLGAVLDKVSAFTQIRLRFGRSGGVSIAPA